MSLYSMTGFAKVSGEGFGAHWSLEVRSVNHKHLDLRFRFPNGFENLEDAVKKEASIVFARGALQVSCALGRQNAEPRPKINLPLLKELVTATQSAASELGTEAPKLDTLLAMRGIVEFEEVEADEEAEAKLLNAIKGDFSKLFKALQSARSGEGERLEALTIAQLKEIERLSLEAGKLAATQPEAIYSRLKTNVDALMDGSGKLDEARLHQEAALLAAKADVREELDRLASHVKEGFDILKAGSPAGRKLDFLAQEFNREANTLCSKSSDSELTKIGLALKLVIDQMREQVQNIE